MTYFNLLIPLQGADIWELKNSDPGLAIGKTKESLLYYFGIQFCFIKEVNNFSKLVWSGDVVSV